MKASPRKTEDTVNVDEEAIVDATISRVRDAKLRSDFWYLQRMNLLPEETMQYVPKIVATMVAAKELGG